MRTASAVVGTVLVLASALGAITPPLMVAREPLQAQTAEQELLALNEGWSKALIARDHGWFERHIADEYIATDPDGALWTKPELLDSLKSVDIAVAPHVMDEIRIRAYGNVGVVFGRSTAKSRRRESTIGQWRYTHVWVKRNARWACVAAHMSKVASAQHDRQVLTSPFELHCEYAGRRQPPEARSQRVFSHALTTGE